MADVTDITEGTLTGNGYFDKFMAAINIHIDAQFDNNRIQGKEYATVYLGALQLALSQAVAYVGIVEQVAASSGRTAAEIALLEQKTITERAQVEDTIDTVAVLGTIGKQKDLQTAQAQGFYRDAEQKALKILMDAWTVSKSVSGDAIDAPDGARNDDMEDMIIKLRQGIEITESIYKFLANAGSDQEVVVGALVQLDGSQSTSPHDKEIDPEEIDTWTWTILENTTASEDPVLSATSTPTFFASANAGRYVFQLDITGDQGSTSTDTVTITVVA